MDRANGIAREKATPKRPPDAALAPFVSAVAPATTQGPLLRELSLLVMMLVLISPLAIR
jgi:hypothetical protein